MGAASTPAAGSCQNSVLPSCDELVRSAHRIPTRSAASEAQGTNVHSLSCRSWLAQCTMAATASLMHAFVCSEDCPETPDAAVHEGSHVWVVVREMNGTVRVNDGDADVLLQLQHLPNVLARAAVDEQHCPRGLHKHVTLPDSARVPPASFQCLPSPFARPPLAVHFLVSLGERLESNEVRQKICVSLHMIHRDIIMQLH